MRVVALLLIFAAAFGVAGLWQSRRLGALREQRELEQRVQDGELGRTPSGLIERGHAVVVVGRPSGTESIVVPAVAPEEAPGTAPGEVPGVEVAPETTPPQLANFELTVQSGQTLSEIARAHYGSAAHELVGALAAYNRLGSVDDLRVGAVLQLPPIDQLPPR